MFISSAFGLNFHEVQKPSTQAIQGLSPFDGIAFWFWKIWWLFHCRHLIGWKETQLLYIHHFTLLILSFAGVVSLQFSMLTNANTLSGSAEILMGLDVVAEVKRLTDGPIVALKRIVWTSWLIRLMIYFISASNPNSSNLSASSKTIISRFSIPTLLEFMSRSMILPGVPITTYGLFLSANYCFWRELAPITKTAYSLVYLLSF